MSTTLSCHMILRWAPLVAKRVPEIVNCGEVSFDNSHGEEQPRLKPKDTWEARLRKA